MIAIIVQAFYFALPAYLANMAPVIFDKFSWLKYFNIPIDGGKKINGEYVFGKNKTWRGIISAVFFSLLVSSIQVWLYSYQFFYELALFDYYGYFFIFGILAGLGAILGDLIKSFIKRRVGIKSGKSWPVFDNLDFIFGFLLFTYYFVQPDIKIIIALVFITLILHPLTNIIGYLLKFKKVWW